MPTLEQIQQFNESLVRFGGEPEVLSERGEVIPQVAPPSASISPDLQELLGGEPADLPAPPTDIDEEYRDELHDELDELDLGALGVDVGPEPDSPDMGLGPLSQEEPTVEPDEEPILATDPEGSELEEPAPIPSFEDLGFGELTDPDATLDDELGDMLGVPDEPVDFDEVIPDLADLLDNAAESDTAEEAPSLLDDGLGLPDLGDIDLGTFDLDDTEAESEFPGDEISLPEEPELPGLDAFLGGITDEADFTLPPEEAFSDEIASPGEEPFEGEDESVAFDESAGEDYALPDLDEPDEEAEGFSFPDIDESTSGDFETGLDDEMPELATPEETEALLGDFGDGEPFAPDQEADAFSMPDVDWGEAPAMPEIDALEPESIEFSTLEDPMGDTSSEIADFSLPEGDIELESGGMLEETVDDDDFVIDEFALPGVDALEDEEASAGLIDGGAPDVTPEIEFSPLPNEGLSDEAFTEKTPAAAGGPEPEYTNREFAAIQRTLSRMPLTLRIAVEQQIGSNQLNDEPLRRLLDTLMRGAAPAEVASALASATGISVDIPRRLEKGTGRAFQKQRRSMSYLFRHSVVPLLRVFLPIAALLVLLIVGVNRFVLTPLRASRLYREGYNELVAERYAVADSAFEEASAVLKIKRWYYDYAAAFRGKKELERAESMYLELIRQWGPEKNAVLQYAGMLTYDLERYEDSDRQLQGFLAIGTNQLDYDGLLAIGDNFIEWADEREEKYDDAGKAYTRVVRTQKRDSDEPWFRLMRYYIRTDQADEVESVKRRFDAARKFEVDPAVFAELGGYYVTKGKLSQARDVLTQAMEADRRLPEVYHQFARYFQAVPDRENEEAALNFALDEYLKRKREENLTRREKRQLILTLGRKAQILFQREEFVKADETYQEATRRIEQGLATGEIRPTKELGAIYAGRGDIHYYVSGDLERALDLYKKARSAGHVGTDLDYKVGYIHYHAQEYQDALLAFHGVTEDRRDNFSALYALANTLYLRGDYFAAQGFYSHLAKKLEDRRRRIPFLRPEENPEHLDLLDMTMRTYNNLGVTMKRLSENVRDPDKESQALVYLTQSLEYFDRISRNPETLTRGEARNLAYLNSRGIIYPQSDFILQIYREIPNDLETLRF